MAGAREQLDIDPHTFFSRLRNAAWLPEPFCSSQVAGSIRAGVAALSSAPKLLRSRASDLGRADRQVRRESVTFMAGMPDALTPAQFVAHSLVPGTGNLHVLGSFEKRVTLWSQQHRALNLVYALHHEGLLGPGKYVAVIGGGVAGLTAAAAAVQKGAEVLVLERQPELLHLLQGNHTRWVHPRIYDWPLPGSEDAHAGLPLLDWEAGLAGDVCEQILTGFHRAAPGCRLALGVEDLQIADGPGPRRRLHWTAGSEEFDLVIFAVGFGIERTVKDLLPVSYWRDDSLHQPEVEPGTRIHLVSGCGDGGLTDLLRLRLTQFRHEHMVREFASGADLDVLKQRLLEIERELPGVLEATRAVWLAERYRALPVPPSLDETLRGRLRERTTVVLNGPGVNLLDAGSAVLNRLLAWRLVRLGAVTYLPGKISRVEHAGTGYEVHFEASPPRRFDRVVIRHGAIPAAEQFPMIWAHRDEFRARGTLDQTRFQIWPNGFYPATPPPPRPAVSPPPHANPAAAGRRISEVFRSSGVPQYNFVPPPRFKLIKDKLRARGRGLVVEGPSGIGKTTAVKMALQALAPSAGFVLLNGHSPQHHKDLGAILDTDFTGHLIIDDVRAFGSTSRDRIATAMYLLSENNHDAKITLIDDADAGAAFLDTFPHLEGRVEIVALSLLRDEDIAQLIREGQNQSNLRFDHPERLVEAARGSAFLAQQLCEKAASSQDILEAPADLVTVECDLERVVEELQIELHPRYHKKIRAFCALDGAPAHRGVCLVLLSLLAKSKDDELPLHVARQRYLALAHTLDWLQTGPLKDRVHEHLQGLVSYDDATAILTLRDPRLSFYLRHMSWIEIARDLGLQVGIDAHGELVFA